MDNVLGYKGVKPPHLFTVVEKAMKRTGGILLFVVVIQFANVIKARYLRSSFSVEAEEEPINRFMRHNRQRPFVNVPMFLPAIGTSFFLCSSGFTRGEGSWSKRCVETMQRMAKIYSENPTAGRRFSEVGRRL